MTQPHARRSSLCLYVLAAACTLFSVAYGLLGLEPGLSMRWLGRIAAFATLTVVGLVGLAVPGNAVLAREMCGNEELSSTAAPDGRHWAVVFQRDCGAASRYSRPLD